MDRIHGSTGPKRRLPLRSAVAGAALFLAIPGAARAGDEFEDGFKDELGRLAAHEAVAVGRGVLANIVLGGHPGYYPVDYPTYYPRYYPRHRHYDYDHGDWGYRHGHGYHWQHRGHHYQPYYGGHRYHGSGWGHHRHHRSHHGHGHGHGKRHRGH